MPEIFQAPAAFYFAMLVALMFVIIVTIWVCIAIRDHRAHRRTMTRLHESFVVRQRPYLFKTAAQLHLERIRKERAHADADRRAGEESGGGAEL